MIPAMDPDEVDRHRHTAAVARRIALTEVVSALDSYAMTVATGNPGRKKGSVAVAARIRIGVVKHCVDMVHEIRGAVNADRIADTARREPPAGVDIYNRVRLERVVESAVPGTYPHLAAGQGGGDG